ncbi:MAG TPA: hypothetical protein VFL16_09110 [Steroidobacteraceae bacterium]|nr:hypothetical protein [Steroidobacteraceae bacterium]
MSAIARPNFHRHIAVALALFTVVGFSRTYYLRFLSDLPPLDALVRLHGAVFTAWLAIFVAQTRLVAANRVDLHMKLGIAAVVLAVAVIWVGLATTAVRASVPRIHPSGLTAAQFSAVGVMSLVLFAGFVVLGILNRRRPALHKRYMVLAMIGVLTPAASRILTLVGLREHWIYLVPVLPALFVVWCLVNDWRKYNLVHPVYAIGGAVITAAWPLRLMMGRADWYQPVAEWFARWGTSLAGA